MDTLIEKMVELGMSNAPTEEDQDGVAVVDGASNDVAEDIADADPTVPPLHVQQVRVLDENGGLRVVYPSRTDLDIQGIKVLRDKKLGMVSSKSGMVSSKSGMVSSKSGMVSSKSGMVSSKSGGMVNSKSGKF